jgi:pimeloyl-ACP methyl ester carboxylesterase
MCHDPLVGITPPRFEGQVAVRDGRRLGIAEWGVPSSEHTVVWFHGTPGGRRQIPDPARRAAAERGIRLIGIDRPGMGLSTPHLYDHLVDFIEDVRIALDQLGVEDFAAVGLSGGGPYALAAGHELGERVRIVGILGGVVPTDGDDGRTAGLVSLAMRLKTVLPLIREPFGIAFSTVCKALGPIGPTALELYAKVSVPGDAAVLRTPEHKAMFLDDLVTGGSRSMRAFGYDAILFTRPWGFSPRDVTQRIIWWQGTDDNIVPMSLAEHIIPMLKDAELRVQPGGGHLSGLGMSVDVLNAVFPELITEPH